MDQTTSDQNVFSPPVDTGSPAVFLLRSWHEEQGGRVQRLCQGDQMFLFENMGSPTATYIKWAANWAWYDGNCRIRYGKNCAMWMNVARSNNHALCYVMLFSEWFWDWWFCWDRFGLCNFVYDMDPPNLPLARMALCVYVVYLEVGTGPIVLGSTRVKTACMSPTKGNPISNHRGQTLQQLQFVQNSILSVGLYTYTILCLFACSTFENDRLVMSRIAIKWGYQTVTARNTSDKKKHVTVQLNMTTTNLYKHIAHYCISLLHCPSAFYVQCLGGLRSIWPVRWLC